MIRCVSISREENLDVAVIVSHVHCNVIRVTTLFDNGLKNGCKASQDC